MELCLNEYPGDTGIEKQDLCGAKVLWKLIQTSYNDIPSHEFFLKHFSETRFAEQIYNDLNKLRKVTESTFIPVDLQKEFPPYASHVDISEWADKKTTCETNIKKLDRFKKKYPDSSLVVVADFLINKLSPPVSESTSLTPSSSIEVLQPGSEKQGSTSPEIPSNQNSSTVTRTVIKDETLSMAHLKTQSMAEAEHPVWRRKFWTATTLTLLSTAATANFASKFQDTEKQRKKEQQNMENATTLTEAWQARDKSEKLSEESRQNLDYAAGSAVMAGLCFLWTGWLWFTEPEVDIALSWDGSGANPPIQVSYQWRW
ncbi:MAG: hypothetical protein HQM12_20305 [SAR324 cluster bacterium]|nr:hypothetical protein [SAR324 cluster bacterium]